MPISLEQMHQEREIHRALLFKKFNEVAVSCAESIPCRSKPANGTSLRRNAETDQQMLTIRADFHNILLDRRNETGLELHRQYLSTLKTLKFVFFLKELSFLFW